jgi:hypothetical protein
LLNIWILSWDARQMLRHPASLFEANFFYPTPQALARTENLLALSLPFSLLKALTGNPVLAYNLVLFAAFWLTCWGMARLVQHWTGRLEAALAAGLIYAFLPLRLFDVARLQLVWGLWLPLAVLAWERVRQAPSFRRGLVLGLVLVAQWASSVYLFFQTALTLVVLAAWDGLRGGSWRRWAPALAGLALGAALLFPLALPYLEQVRRWPYDHSATLGYYSARPASFLHSQRENLVWGRLAPEARDGQARPPLFPGATAALLALAGLAVGGPRRGPLALLAVLATLLALGTSIGLPGGLPSPFEFLYQHFPGFQAQRVPWRYGLLLGFAVAALAGLALARLAGRPAWLALGLILLESLSPMPKVTVPEIPALYRRLGQLPPGPLLEIPLALAPHPVPYPEGFRLYASTVHWQSRVNGYPTLAPPPTQEIARYLSRGPTEEFQQVAAALGLRYLLIHEEELTPAERRLWQGPLPHTRLLAEEGGLRLLACRFPEPPRATRLRTSLDAPRRAPARARVLLGLVFAPEGEGLYRDPDPGQRIVDYRWLNAAGTPVRLGKARVVPPSFLLGEARLEPLQVLTPDREGPYVLEVEGPGWRARAPVQVAALATAGTLAGVPPLGLRLPTVAEPQEPGATLLLRGQVANLGDIPLPAGGRWKPGESWLCFRWADGAGRPLESWKQPLAIDLYPGQSCPWETAARTPLRPGAYELQICLARLDQEASDWAGIPVQVGPSSDSRGR